MTPTDGVIAVVDDDDAVCKSIRFLFEMYDFEVCAYQSGAAFLDDDPAIACLIVDYQMPGLNGLEVVSELRQRGRLAQTIIMITATSDPLVDRRAAELGITVLKKPLSNQVLLKAVRNEEKQ